MTKATSNTIYMKTKKFLKSFLIHPPSDRSFLTNYLQDNATVAEIGVWTGDFSELLLQHSWISKYYLIDPFEFMPQFPNRWYGGTKAKQQEDMEEIFVKTQERLKKFSSKLTFLRKRSNEAAEEISNCSLDFLYIDGNHYYDGVLSDLQLYHKKMKVGGYLVCDDWSWKDEDGNLSVRIAVCNYMRDNPNTLELIEIQNGQAVILVIDNLQT